MISGAQQGALTSRIVIILVVMHRETGKPGSCSYIEYEFSLAAPKPDAYLGYSRGQQSRWSTSQYNVISHPRARPYTQPGRDNTFPFLMFGLKSEAAGGTLYAAENQAAGSGSHSVNALLWLLQEAQKSGLSDTDLMRDTVSFSFVMSHIEAVFYMHWQSTEDHRQPWP